MYDRLGDGCMIDFPIRMQPKLKFGTKCYDKNTADKLVLKKRSFLNR